jgi:hypothetical protein
MEHLASQISPELLDLFKVISQPEATEEIVYHGAFPAEDVDSCLDVPLDSLKFRRQQPCTKCNRLSHHLRWIRYSSRAATWERGAGVAGALSLCDSCGVQVQFIPVQQH